MVSNQSTGSLRENASSPIKMRHHDPLAASIRAG